MTKLPLESINGLSPSKAGDRAQAAVLWEACANPPTPTLPQYPKPLYIGGWGCWGSGVGEPQIGVLLGLLGVWGESGETPYFSMFPTPTPAWGRFGVVGTPKEPQIGLVRQRSLLGFLGHPPGASHRSRQSAS